MFSFIVENNFFPSSIVNAIGFSEKLKIFGIPDEFPIVGSQLDQREAAGLTKKEIIRKLSLELSLEELNKKISTQQSQASENSRN